MAAKYRTKFDISITDLDLIEKALRHKAGDLGREMLDRELTGETSTEASDEQLKSDMTAIQSVLGKLHNQKIWYAPENFSPLG